MSFFLICSDCASLKQNILLIIENAFSGRNYMYTANQPLFNYSKLLKLSAKYHNAQSIFWSEI